MIPDEGSRNNVRPLGLELLQAFLAGGSGAATALSARDTRTGAILFGVSAAIVGAGFAFRPKRYQSLST